MKFRAHGATDLGLVRKRNEDSFILDAPAGFFAVADGIGGMPGGDIASRTAVTALRKEIARTTTAGRFANLTALVQSAHTAVREAGRGFGPDGIGTTLTFAHIAAGSAHIAHVGDSFAFLVRGGACRALTREHNIENERDNHLSLSAYPPSYRYALTRVIGQEHGVVPDIFEEKLRAGDRLVLATDGLTDLLEPAEIAKICAAYPDVEKCAAAMINGALARGGHDNITVIVVAVDEV